MLKSIPKSNISRRSFKVYKRFNADENNYSFQTASADISESLYRSIKSKYYTDNGLVNNYGTLNNPAEFSSERPIFDTIYVLKLDQDKFGEKIKPGTVGLTPNGNSELEDDGFGRLTSPDPSYNISTIDLDNEELIISQSGEVYTVSLLPDNGIDINAGTLKVIDNGVTETYTLISIDYDSGVMVLGEPLDIEEIGLAEQVIGNVFYSDGLIVITQENSYDLSSFDVSYRSTQTIHETEILIEAKAGEFNYSQNPSAVDVTLSGSYDFTTTAIPNVSPAKTVKIKEVRDIKRKVSYDGSIGSTTGSWDDYDTNRLSDPTGSYLAPYITTIGIYDNEGDMVAIAKLPTPIKNLPDYDMNFIVRFDT